MTSQQVKYYSRKIEIGDHVWAKMKTYCPWPARVVGLHKTKLYVYFYGTENYGYVQRKDVTYHRIFDETTILNKKSAALKKAISLFYKSIENSPSGSDQDVSEEEISSYSKEGDLRLDYVLKRNSSKKIVSVNFNDEAAVKKLIKKELSVSLIRSKPKQRMYRTSRYEELSGREWSDSEYDCLLSSSRSEGAKKKLFQIKKKASKV